MLLAWKNKINIGTIIKLEKQIKLWNLKMPNTEYAFKEIPFAKSVPSNLTENNVTDISIKLDTILQDTSAGRKLQDNYLKDPQFTDASRTVLLTLITNFFETHEKKMTSDIAKSLSEEIVQKFPSENIVSYEIQAFIRVCQLRLL